MKKTVKICSKLNHSCLMRSQRSDPDSFMRYSVYIFMIRISYHVGYEQKASELKQLFLFALLFNNTDEKMVFYTFVIKIYTFHCLLPCAGRHILYLSFDDPLMTVESISFNESDWNI